MNISVLKNFSKKNYFSKPFPHFVINQMFDEKTYNFFVRDYKVIINSFKTQKKFEENNIRLQYSTNEIIENKLFRNTIWNDFVNYHTSKDFMLTLIEIFSDDLKIIYPKVLNEIYSFKNRENFLYTRSSDIHQNIRSNFVIDCQPGINTPVRSKSSVRGPHVDNPVELIGGLAYFRDADDVSEGGNLKLFEKKSSKIFFHEKAEVYNLNNLHHCKTIDYKQNNCIFFLNTESSIHSISPRSKTDKTRNLVNFIVEKYDDNKFFKMKRANFINKIFSRLI